MIGSERLYRGGHGETTSFDWYEPAWELRIPLERAHALYEKALAAHLDPRRAQELYLDWLSEAAAQRRRVPGKRTRTMRPADGTRSWPRRRRPDGAPIAPGKKVRSAALAGPPQSASTALPRDLSADRVPEILHRLLDRDPQAPAAARDATAPAPEEVELTIDLRFQLARSSALQEMVLLALDAFASGRMSDPSPVSELFRPPVPRQPTLSPHPYQMFDLLGEAGSSWMSGQPVIPAWTMSGGAALANVVHRRATTIFRRELSDADVDLHDPDVEEALDRRGPGVPLAESVRQDMEARFGADFRRVRVHTDDIAARAAEALYASAFTLGEDIFFAAGAFAPSGETGQQLLVHELTHVVQAQQGRVPASHDTEVSRPGDALEQEAAAAYDRISTRVAAINELVPAGAPPLPTPHMLLRAPDKKATPQAPGRNVSWLSWDTKFVIGFVDGLIRAGAKGITAGTLAKIQRDFTNPLSIIEIYAGYQLGIPAGAAQDLWDNVTGLAQIAKWVFWHSPIGLEIQMTKELYEWVTDREGKAAREREKLERTKDFIEGMGQFALQIAKDPGIMADLGEDFGEVAGDYVARSCGDFANARPFEKGWWIGKGVGYVAMEIALLFVGPELLVEKVPAAIAKIGRAGGKAVQAILRLMEKIPALRKLLKAAGWLGKVAETVGPEAKLLAHLEESIVQKVLQQGLKLEDIEQLAKLEKTAAEKLLKELPAKDVLTLENQLGKAELETLAKTKTGKEIQTLAEKAAAEKAAAKKAAGEDAAAEKAKSKNQLLDKDPGPPAQPLTKSQWRNKIDAAEEAGDKIEARRLRRQRYLQDCAEQGKKPQSLAEWENLTGRLEANAAKGAVGETHALGELGVPNNNTIATAKNGKIMRFPDPPIEGKPSCRPDGVSEKNWVDVKTSNEKTLYMTEQHRLELAGAQADGGKGLAVVIVTDVPKGKLPVPRPSGPLADQAKVFATDSKGNWWQWGEQATGEFSWLPSSAGKVKAGI